MFYFCFFQNVLDIVKSEAGLAEPIPGQEKLGQGWVMRRGEGCSPTVQGKWHLLEGRLQNVKVRSAKHGGLKTLTPATPKSTKGPGFGSASQRYDV